MSVGYGVVDGVPTKTGRTSIWSRNCFIGVYDGALVVSGGFFLKHSAAIWDNTGYGSSYENILPLPGVNRSYYISGVIFTPKSAGVAGEAKVNLHSVSRDASGNPVLGRVIFTYYIHWRTSTQLLKYPVEDVSCFPVAIPVGNNLSIGYSVSSAPSGASASWWVLGFVGPYIESAYS